MKIHHIGYLVKKMSKSIKEFRELGYQPVFCKSASDIVSPEMDDSDTVVQDNVRKIEICFMRNDTLLIELICPYEQNSVVANYMKTHSNSPYHICYESFDIDQDIMLLRTKGYVITQEPQPAVAIGGTNVSFLLNCNLGLIELVQK